MRLWTSSDYEPYEWTGLEDIEGEIDIRDIPDWDGRTAFLRMVNELIKYAYVYHGKSESVYDDNARKVSAILSVAEGVMASAEDIGVDPASFWEYREHVAQLRKSPAVDHAISDLEAQFKTGASDPARPEDPTPPSDRNSGSRS